MNKELILQTADKQWKISSINNGKYPLLGTVRPEVIHPPGIFRIKSVFYIFLNRYLQYLKKKKKHAIKCVFHIFFTDTYST